MTGRAFGEALLVGAAFVVVALALGGPLVLLLERLECRALGRSPSCAVRPLPWSLGAALLAGFGAEALVGIVLGLLGILSAASVLACALTALSVGYWNLRPHRARLRRHHRHPPDRFAQACLAAAASLYAVSVLASMTPPTAWDEMAYHLPEAQLIATTGELPLTVGEHYFYGNIPKLVEVLFAEALLVADVDAPHMVHVAIFGAFLVFLFGILTALVGRRSAALAVLLIVLYDELAWNATTAYVDAATVCFEIAALLSALAFASGRRPGDAALAATFIGFAAAAKYAALATLVIVAVLLLGAALIQFRKRIVPSMRLVGLLGAIFLVTAGFWYGKNLIRFGNPTYPLLFGHPGVDEQSYEGLVDAIQMFGPRTLWGLLAIPSRFATPHDVLLLLSLSVAPLALLARRYLLVVLVLLTHLAWYTTYWFFFGSHQLRFFLPAGVTASILAAVAVTRVPRQTLPAVGILAAFAAFVAYPHIGQTLVVNPQSVIAQKIQSSRLSYPLGLQSRDAFLSEELGCQYEIIRYLEMTELPGRVIDNWSQWHDTPATFYAREKQFVPFTSESRDPDVIFRSLRSEDIRFVYFRPSTKERFSQNTDPLVRAYRAGRDEVEEIILTQADLLLQIDDCQLFAIRSSMS